MEFLGVTAVEDMLSENVSETISLIKECGIKLWVLTGDKTETAINIAYACKLITTEMSLAFLDAKTMGGIEE